MNKLYDEAEIEINGNLLSPSQSMVIRVALESFISYLFEEGLGDNQIGIDLKNTYLARCNEIRKHMYGDNLPSVGIVVEIRK